MKQYSFLFEAKLSDYFVSTIGTFRKLFSGKSYVEYALKANMKGFKFHHLSRSGYSGNISSIYFTSPDKTKLLRISDHWSETNLQGVNACGNIRNCYWRLIGKQNSKPEGYVQAGIIDLNKLNYMDSVKQSTPRKYFGDVLNPYTHVKKLDFKSEPNVSRNNYQKSLKERIRIAAQLAREEAKKRMNRNVSGNF